MHYVGEDYAVRSEGKAVYGADKAHEALRVLVSRSRTQQKLPSPQDEEPPVSPTVLEQAKKALSTGSGPSADWSTCIRFRVGVRASGLSHGPGACESGACTTHRGSAGIIHVRWPLGWLAGWLVGCLAAWLPGCLPARYVSQGGRTGSAARIAR